jgi:hypothetical protein
MRTMLLAAGLAVMFSQGTVRPGDIPRPDVWIKNGSAEPIPVDVREVHVEKPIAVVLMNGETSSSAAAAPIRVRVVPPAWSYRTLVINATTGDPAGLLQGAGAEGWETTGLVWTRGADTVVLMKRAVAPAAP